jgi:hypothetical protein
MTIWHKNRVRLCPPLSCARAMLHGVQRVAVRCAAAFMRELERTMIQPRWPRRVTGFVIAVLTAALVGGANAPAQAQPASPTLFSQLQAQLGRAQTAGLRASLRDQHEPGGPRLILPADEPASGPAEPASLETPPASSRRVAVDPPTGVPGSRITVSGEGYPPDARLKIYWGTENITGRRLVVAGADGSFSTTVDVPRGVASGVHTIAVVEATAAALAANGGPGGTAVFSVAGGSAPPQVTFDSVLQARSRPPPDSADVGGRAPQVEPRATIAECPTPPPVNPAPKAWTFAVYMGADSELVNDARANLLDIARSGGTNANANLVVLLDIKNEPTRYFEVRSAPSRSVPELCSYVFDRTPQGIRGQNVDTGDLQTFVAFMQFVAQNFPAQRYALTLWSHGGGWRGIEADDTANSYWTMAELRAALAGGLQQLGRAQYDLLLFDACYMAQYEVALEISDLANVLVGSEEEMPSSGLRYADFLPGLLFNPGITPDQFAKDVVGAFAAYYGPKGIGNQADFTLSALKLGAPFNEFSNRLNRMADGLVTIAGTTAGQIIQQFRRNTRSYHDRDFADAGDFADKLRVTTNADIPAPIKDSAASLLAYLAPGQDFVLAEAHGADASRSNGISVYFPESGGKPFRGRAGLLSIRLAAQGDAIAPGYDQLAVNRTAWYRLIKGLRTGNFPNTAPPPPVDFPAVPPPAAASTQDIAFSSIVNPLQIDLYRASSSRTSDPLLLLQDEFINLYARWSPDGRALIYISSRGADLDSRIGISRNLFLLNADGTPPDDPRGPRQLTASSLATSCPVGSGTGQPCTVEQSFDPAWLSDGSGVLYTRRVYDLSRYPFYDVRQSIRVMAPDGSNDFEVLPRPDIFGDLVGNLVVSNADLKAASGQIQYLLFRYAVPGNLASQYNPSFASNNIGCLDFTNADNDQPEPRLDAEDVYGFFFNLPNEVQAGNYLIADYPAWRPNSNEAAFLYNRVGRPVRLNDPRAAPPAGVPDRRNPFYPFFGGPLYDTYDIARFTIVRLSNGDGSFRFEFRNLAPIWSFTFAATGAGVNYRPSWKPDGSGFLTASFSADGGYSYDVGVFPIGASQGTLLTDDGQSGLPSWGAVQSVRQRLEVTPRYLLPGENAIFYLSGSGFQPGSTVELLVVVGNNSAVIGSVQARADGTFIATFRLLPTALPGPITFAARGTPLALAGAVPAAVQVSNQDILVALSKPVVRLPLIRR